MKKTAILASLAAALMLSAFTGTSRADLNATEVAAPAKARTFAVETAASEVNWNAKKVTGEHYGKISMKSGQLQVDKNRVTGGTFEFDMSSITVEDIKDAGMNGKLVGHLKSDDFFGVEKNPSATFVITEATPITKAAAGKPNYNVKGNLTIKGITNPVSFPATIAVKDGVATAKADVTVDRTKFDIRYRSSNFFENLGDKAIYDEFTVSFNVKAKQTNS
ncbi:YceI family protein [Pontibacter virosus]|uniref:Polyisoprenoid-binding protein YceI n=1 Tax=Pontibacter virosus TaxID=1765052 RepID=A0A2U1B2Z8_9BACT|nr:YceI family protein [Pontibacter virosus]PVY43049.1 polyisoprenoid-binding protein YceI [Pontibacter virosus]